MKFNSILATATSTLAVGAALITTPAFAQSTGSMDFDNSIVVTGARDKSVAGVELPSTPKAKQVLTQAVIARETPGQTIDDTINLIPGVSFQNNDGYGSMGGTLMIRGFDDSRISQTFDGIPLNDTGNYALYTNQQLDPELIEQVNVNLGTTDVDSPTAAASGSTVNYRSVDPTHDFGARMVGTVGDFNKLRLFGMINTGDLNSTGTRAWFAMSKDTYNAPYGGIGKVDKTQFNAKIYQPLGDNGDFISIAGHYNRNRNNFGGSVPLVDENFGTTPVSGNSFAPNSATGGRFPTTKDERYYDVARCTVAAGVSGTADAASSCGTAFEYRYNPSNTANIRVNSKFSLNDKLTLTVDPYFQYTTANGGGTVRGYEGGYTNAAKGITTPIAGYIGGYPYFNGVDLNGDGDTLDQVTLAAPSQTVTYRIGVIASLRYDLSDTQHIRVAYTYDRGRHRQTGELGYLKSNGFTQYYFQNNNDTALTDVNGNVLEKRDRLSYAILQQASGEYSGEFGNLHVVAGVRVPFFKRNLTQNCLTTSASGYVDCFSTDSADAAIYSAANPGYAQPRKRVFSYNRALPNVGLTFNFTPTAQVYANYSKGLQVPGTDNLYQAFYYSTTDADPKPESTDNFDFGVRYQSGMIQASLGGWYTIFSNRLSSNYNQDTQTTTYTNLGKVDRYGIDGTLAFRPDRHVSAYVFGSYLWSKIRGDIQTGATTYADTDGNMEGAIPHFTLGGRLQGDLGPVSIGVEAKRTGSRYYNDLNTAVLRSGVEVYGAKVPAYTLVNLDARVNAAFIGMGEGTYLQFNVTNLFDKLYVGGFDDAGVSNTSTVFAQIGAPRTISGSINFQF